MVIITKTSKNKKSYRPNFWNGGVYIEINIINIAIKKNMCVFYIEIGLSVSKSFWLLKRLTAFVSSKRLFWENVSLVSGYEIQRKGRCALWQQQCMCTAIQCNYNSYIYASEFHSFYCSIITKYTKLHTVALTKLKLGF